MSHQKFYIPDYPLDYEIALLIVETKLRISNTGKQCFVKLPKHTETDYPILAKYPCYNDDTIQEVLSRPEWQPRKEDLL